MKKNIEYKIDFLKLVIKKGLMLKKLDYALLIKYWKKNKGIV